MERGVRHEAVGGFTLLVGRTPDVLVRAPGRVNLIGEHTDYNDGYVLPLAIAHETAAALGRREDQGITLVSMDIDPPASLSARRIDPDPQRGWANYPAGVIRKMKDAASPVGGFDAVFASSVPVGSGLSSSAALEMATAMGVKMLFGSPLTKAAMARAGQEAERDFAGVACGIMDQLVSMEGKEGKAVLIDCRSLEVTHVPCDLSGYSLLLADTTVRRELAGSEYNRRREECERAVQALADKGLAVQSLRDVTEAMLDEHGAVLDEVALRRARHVVEENGRVLAAVRALESNDLSALGALLRASHASLRDLYEVSCPELDTLAAAANQHDAVLGARMVGGGFGGSVLCLTKTDALDDVIDHLTTAYRTTHEKEPAFVVVEPGDGASVLDITPFLDDDDD